MKTSLYAKREGTSVVIVCDTPLLRARVVNGTAQVWEVRSLPPQPIPADYDPHDKSNFRSCCDPPTE